MRMMAFFLFLNLIFSGFAFAESYNSCNGEFQGGIGNFQMAKSSFDSAMDDYNSAVSESRQGTPRIDVICNALLNSGIQFDRAADEYGRTSRLFGMAVRSCDGENRSLADHNKGICDQNFRIASDNYNEIKRSYEAICLQGTEMLELDLSLKPSRLF